MIRAIQKHVHTAAALLTGFVIAVLFAPIVLATVDWYSEWRDSNNPPATLKWNTVEWVGKDVLRVTLLVTRHDDCQMLRAQGYSGKSLSSMYPSDSFEREDGRQPQSYPVGITVVSRPWLMRGIYGNKMAISAYYDCDGRILKAPLLIGDVPAFANKGERDE